MSDRAQSSGRPSGPPAPGNLNTAAARRVDPVHEALMARAVANAMQNRQAPDLSRALLERRRQQEEAALAIAARNQQVAAQNQQLLTASALQQRATNNRNQLLDAQLLDAQYRDSQYLQQLSQYREAPPVMVYIPPTMGTAQSLAGITGQTREPELLDLTGDSDDEDERGNVRRAIPAISEKKRKKTSVPTATVIKKKRAASATSTAQVSRNAAPIAHSATATVEAQTTRTKTTALAPAQRSERMATSRHATKPHPKESPRNASIRQKARILGKNEVDALCKKMLAVQQASGDAPAGSLEIAQMPLIICPDQLKQISSGFHLKSLQHTDAAIRQRNKIIEKQKEVIESLRKQNSSGQSLALSERNKYIAEIEEIRRQSERSMRSYMKATVHAFEKLHEEQANSEIEDESDEEG